VDIEALSNQYSSKTPEDILRLALESYDNVAISFSGAEDVVLVDMACRIKSDVRVFSLDTGRLHPETYRFLDRVRERYPIRFEVLTPDAMALERLIREKGLFSFYQDGHQECCGVRKVGPLRRRLQTLDAWVTGQRKDQSLATRAAIAVVERDGAFSTPEHTLIKFNPLANWTAAEVWDYIRGNDVPYNELHERGFVSIGCEPCTRAVLPYQQEREGRWWWEDAAQKECGLHKGNVAAGGR
jgi:phosphoadenosine phosphosulfate reductase